MEAKGDMLRVYMSGLGGVNFDSRLEFPIAKRLSKGALESLKRGLPRGVTVLHDEGYYNPLVVSAPISMRAKLRELGFDTGSMPLILGHMYPVSPCVGECDDGLARLVSEADSLRRMRKGFARAALRAKATQNPGYATHLLNSLDELLEFGSKSSFLDGLKGNSWLRKLPDELIEVALSIHTQHRQLNEQLLAYNGRLVRVGSRGRMHWEPFICRDIDDYVDIVGKASYEDLIGLRLAFMDLEVPLYLVPELARVSWATLAIIQNLEVVDRVLMSAHELPFEMHNGYRAISVFKPGMDYTQRSQALATLVGDFLEEKRVDILVAHNIAYDLGVAKGWGMKLRGESPITRARAGFMARMGLDSLCIADTLGFFLPRRNLPNRKFATIVQHLAGLQQDPSQGFKKTLNYRQLEGNERLVLGLDIPKRCMPLLTENPEEALILISDYAVSDVEAMATRLPGSSFYSSLARIMAAYNLTTDEATYLPHGVTRFLERHFYAREHVTPRAATRNYKLEKEAQQKQLKLLGNILNNLIALGLGKQPSAKLTKPYDDKRFYIPGIHKDVALALIPWELWFREFVVRAFPQLEQFIPEEMLEQELGLSNLNFSWFSNHLVKRALSMLAGYIQLSEDETPDDRLKSRHRKLGYKIYKMYGINPEELERIVEQGAMQLGERLGGLGLVAKSQDMVYLTPSQKLLGLVLMDTLPLVLVTKQTIVFEQYGSFNCFKAPLDEYEYIASPLEKRTVKALWDSLVSNHPSSFVEYFQWLCERALSGGLRRDELAFYNKTKGLFEVYCYCEGKPKRVAYPSLKDIELDYAANLQVFFGTGTNTSFDKTRLGRYLAAPELMAIVAPIMLRYQALFSARSLKDAQSAQCHSPSQQQAGTDRSSF